jgi:hypothetical protein
MKLSNFNVVHARPEAAVILDDPPVHCFAGDQIVLAYVARQALMDHFKVRDERCVATAACPRASEAGGRWAEGPGTMRSMGRAQLWFLSA